MQAAIAMSQRIFKVASERAKYDPEKKKNLVST